MLLLRPRVLGTILEKGCRQSRCSLHRRGAGRRADVDRQDVVGNDGDGVGGLEAGDRLRQLQLPHDTACHRLAFRQARLGLNLHRGILVAVVDEQDCRVGVVGRRELQVQRGTNRQPDHAGEAPDPGLAPQGGREES